MFADRLAKLALAPVALAGAAAATGFLVAARLCGKGLSGPLQNKGPYGGRGHDPEQDYVRPAGPETMENPPHEGWTKEDEASDESFPASDPPARY